MKRFLTWLLPAILLLTVSAYLARNAIARQALEMSVKHQTGARCDVGSVDLDLLGGRLEIGTLRLMNPPGFAERPLIDLPTLRVEYDTVSMLRGRPRIRSIAINVKEVFIATSANGEQNVARLASTAGDSAPSHKPRPYRVDVLRVHVGTVLIEDDSRGRHTQRRLTLNTDATYRNISESTDLSRLVLGSVFDQVGPVVGGAARGLGEALKSGSSRVGKARKDVLDILRKGP